ncbi:hypothetical protein NPIL_216881 [Nephila pilipes]|uniref:Uncharacterized protein n=1 Tax=Nephila pilipes TaxID=299642 RepID=A0A8X6T2R3_NEPPI|nr:hypothetical protein NPIL_216881 [Nephila pilipes]
MLNLKNSTISSLINPGISQISKREKVNWMTEIYWNVKWTSGRRLTHWALGAERFHAPAGIATLRSRLLWVDCRDVVQVRRRYNNNLYTNHVAPPWFGTCLS